MFLSDRAGDAAAQLNYFMKKFIIIMNLVDVGVTSDDENDGNNYMTILL